MGAPKHGLEQNNVMDFINNDDNINMFVECMSPAIIESAFVVVCMDKSKMQQNAQQGKNPMESIADMHLMMPFMQLMQRFQTLQDQKACDELNKKSQGAKDKPPQAIILEGGHEEPVHQVEELEDRKVSDHRSSTNIAVTILMIIVCIALMGGIYFLIKSLGNPASSEYPEHLEHRESEYPDQEAVR